MTDIQKTETSRPIGPPCPTCSSATRIYGIEPHIRLPQTDIHTYVCDSCDTSQAVIVPLLPSLRR